MGKRYHIEIDNVTHVAEIIDINATTARVAVDGQYYTVNLESAGQETATPISGPMPPAQPGVGPTRPVEGSPAPAPAAGDGDVTAPMPGKLLKYLVGIGDTVEAGQAVCVLEAMKMENQLPAPIKGKVVDLPAGEGADVPAKAVLVRIEATS